MYIIYIDGRWVGVCLGRRKTNGRWVYVWDGGKLTDGVFVGTEEN